MFEPSKCRFCGTVFLNEPQVIRPAGFVKGRRAFTHDACWWAQSEDTRSRIATENEGGDT